MLDYDGGRFYIVASSTFLGYYNDPVAYYIPNGLINWMPNTPLQAGKALTKKLWKQENLGMTTKKFKQDNPLPRLQLEARLIALAPDLFSCLKDLISTVKIVSTSKGWALDNAIKLIEEVEKKGV